ncbi:MAG: HAMP domain-containing sensor histidine kinase [Gemmatimonas sp.]
MNEPEIRRFPAWLREGRSLLSLFGALMLLIMAVVFGVVREARRASNAERLATARSSREVASYATWSIMNAAESLTLQLFAAMFSGLNSDTSSAAAPVPPLSQLLSNMANVKRRSTNTHYTIRADTFFRFVAANKEFAVATGNGTTVEGPSWLRDSVPQIAARLGGPFAMALMREGSTTYAVVLTAVRTKSGQVIGALGFVADVNTLSAGLFEFMNSGASELLPADIARGLPNDSLFAVQLRDQHGNVLWNTRNWRPGLQTDTAGFFPRLASLVLHVAVPPEALGRLALVPPSSSRLPFLIVLLTTVVVLGLLVLRQMKREFELARVRLEFTAGVSHELRTPLAQILLYGETLTLGRVRSDRERDNAAEVIVMESRRLMHLVENVLHFASVERNVARVTSGTVPIGAVMAEVLVLFAPLAATERAAILVSDIDLSATVRADASAVRQILINLLENALKYGPTGQTIRITCVVRGELVEMAVEDEGPGVAVEDRDRIWEPFVRVATAGAQRAGTGIGLAVVRDLAERCEATVSVGDRLEGKGGRFLATFKRSV